MPRSQARRNLFAIAKDQSGFFTTKQAKAAGFAEKTHPYHVQTGNWIREYRGIYRLADFPAVERPDLMVWYLWSRGRDEVPQGVYSHETALSLYELSDANPSKLHMTVPTTFRRNSEIPSVLVLHRGNIPPQDTQEMFAVRCTTPLRSIRDLVTEPQTDKVLLRQAVREALARGLTMRNDLDRKDFPTEVRRELRALAEGARRG
ncbi:MAG TPA: type IV toxin-antitoxin system AbiEi family antitoxin domain-containing protein [Terriglobia bacterium]